MSRTWRVLNTQRKSKGERIIDGYVQRYQRSGTVTLLGIKTQGCSSAALKLFHHLIWYCFGSRSYFSGRPSLCLGIRNFIEPRWSSSAGHVIRLPDHRCHAFRNLQYDPIDPSHPQPAKGYNVIAGAPINLIVISSLLLLCILHLISYLVPGRNGCHTSLFAELVSTALV